MTRPDRRRTVVCLAAGLLTSLLLVRQPAPAGAAEGDADPLQVTIDRVGPSTIPTRGPITVTGTITNTSESAWSDLYVYLLTSTEPFTTSAELTAQAATKPTTYVGQRLTDPGLYVTVPDLAPGASTRYRLRVPRGELVVSGAPGVYWLGVQVLGADENGRTEGADGRARTFIPLIPRTGPRTSVALILPFRGRIAHTPAGRLVAEKVWLRALGPGGRFGRLLDLSGSAGAYPLTWVLDPAVVDVARALAAGNPGFGIGPAAAGGPSRSATSAADAADAADGAAPSAEAQTARDWLAGLRDEARRRDVLALPYGDVDVAAAYRKSFGGMVRDARKLSEKVLRSVDVASTPVVDPADGALPWAAVSGTGSDAPVVMSRSSVSRATGARIDASGGARITLTDPEAVSEIGGAVAPVSALALRQRILAAAAVHALSADADEPLVVQLPNRWDPGAGWRRAKFFEGLDVPWLTGTSAASVVNARLAGDTMVPGSGRLVYPETAQAAELPAVNFATASRLVRRGRTFEVLLTRNDTIDDRLATLAYLGTSMQLRGEPERARGRTARIGTAVGGLMGRVTLSGPRFVTMSSEDGQFQVIVTNGLDQPVRVGVRAHAVGTDKIRIPPAGAADVAAGARRTVRMHANSSRIGVYPIVLEPVNARGMPLGSTTDFKIRSSHVGQVIWAILGLGSAVLLVAIVLRVRRRVRTRRATHGPLLKQESV